MVTIAPWIVLLYALVVLAGGIVGYLKARSKPSLISGLVSGFALLIAGIIAFQQFRTGITLAMILAIALLIIFAIRFRKTNKFMPAGFMATLSLVGAVVFAIALSL